MKLFRRSAAFEAVPKEAFNWHYYMAVFTFGVLGLVRGLDEGIISSQVLMPAFKRDYGVLPGSTEQSNITSMVQIGCVGGSILAWFTNDWLGRIKSNQITLILWLIGTIIWMTSKGNLGQLYAGRLITGFGVGGTAVCGPTYLAEVAPKSLRGSLLGVGLFSGSVYLGTLLGYGANLGVQRHVGPESANQYLIPTSLNLMLGGLFLISTFFCIESPRWLAKKHRIEEGYQNMQKLRQLRPEHPYLKHEWGQILESIQTESEAKGDDWKWYSSMVSMVSSTENLYILICTVGAQVWGQFSGAGSIAVYAPQLFQAVSGRPTTKGRINPSTTVVFGAVKLASSLLSALFLLDRFGRKTAAMTGIIIQAISMLYIAIYLHVCPADSPESSGKKHGGEAAIVFMYFAGIGWAGGINSIQYILGAEMYSVVVRSLGVMISMMIHFVCQFGSSRAVNPMIAAMGPWGLFLFWALESFVCLFLVWFFIPETAGYSLEEMHQLFTGPWYKIGWKHNRPFKEASVDDHKVSDSTDPNHLTYDDLEQKAATGMVISQDDEIDGGIPMHRTDMVYTTMPQTRLPQEELLDKKLGADEEEKKA